VEKVNAQLLKKVDSLPKNGEWLFELKHDGWRILAFVNSDVKLISRNDNDFTKKFADVTRTLRTWANGRSFVIDGEMLHDVYMVFDVLALDGKDLRGQTLLERKKILEQLMKDAPSNIRLCQYVKSMTEQMLQTICQNGHEGVVAKLTNSTYSAKRDGRWIKIKCQGYKRVNETNKS